MVARQAHNLEAVGSSPTPATICTLCRNRIGSGFFVSKKQYCQNQRSLSQSILIVPEYIVVIGFAERSERIVYKLIPADLENAKEFVEDINSHQIEELNFIGNSIAVFLSSEDNKQHVAALTFTDLIFCPQTIKDISKKHIIVSVEFYPGSKLYDYLCNDDDVKIDDIKTVVSRGETKQVRVKKIKYLYEDQLPLPYDKMAKIQ